MKMIKRNIRFWIQRRTRGWSDDDCWNLDYTFVKWLNEHLKVYKRQASKVVNLEFHKFKYKRKEYTQLQLIDKMIDLSNEYLSAECGESKLDSIKDEILDIFKLIFWTLWW